VKRQQSEEQASTMGAYLSTPTIKKMKTASLLFLQIRSRSCQSKTTSHKQISQNISELVLDNNPTNQVSKPKYPFLIVTA
jgi:hypothetical protein